MNRIDALIKQFCPTGVEYKPMGEIGTFVRGRRFVKDDIVDEGVPCIHYGEMYTHYGIWAKETKSFLKQEVAAKLRVAHPGDVVIVAAGETVEDIGSGVAWLGNEDVVIHDACYVFSHKLDPKFVSYFLQTNSFHSQIKRYISSGKISSISAKGLEKAKIPVPPREVQNAIVDVLDSFLELETELGAELEARQKQYDYYLNELVRSENFTNVEWKQLSEIANISTGVKPKIIHTDSKGVPYINAGNEPSGYTEMTNTEGGTITIPSRGQGGAGHVGFQDNDFWCGPLCYKITSTSSQIINKFLYYFLKNIQNKIVELRKVGSIPAVNKSDLGKIKVPMPSLENQKKVVEILDKFDLLVKSSSDGLPAEIKVRRKQYEYYNNELLTFQELTI